MSALFRLPRPRSNNNGPPPPARAARACGAWVASFAVAALAASAGCTGRGGGEATAADSGADPTAGLDRALALAGALIDGGTPLPARAEVLALAESIEARAVREGAGPRAVELHATAARLVERVWRVEGLPQDADEALQLHRAAAREADMPGACEAALAAARLAGELAHDPSTTYAEVFRTLRRFSGGPGGDGGAGAPRGRMPGASTCLRDADDALAALAAYRPPARVLEAIDDGLQGEGAPLVDLAGLADAGALVPVQPPRIVQIDAWPGPDTARVVIVLDRPAAYRVNDEVTAGEATPHTYVDLDGVDLAQVPRDSAQQGVVAHVHAEATSTGSRVRLDLDGRAWRRVFHLNEPYRVVIDVARHPPGAAARSPRALARVVLDPGHGGRDTGATGPDGLREKDVTLDIVHRLAPVLRAQGIQVVSTRDDDRYVSLEERTARANAFSADLFVSVHCNASDNRTRRGVEAYVLDTTRDEIAARVAARENATTQAANADLGAILGGMRLADQAQKSDHFARLLERAAMAGLRLRYEDAIEGGVHPAGFYVLVGARMPSVLFETSYVSNPIEEQRLGTPAYRQALADSIANAIIAYREGR